MERKDANTVLTAVSKMLLKLLPKRKINPRIDNELLTSALVQKRIKEESIWLTLATGIAFVLSVCSIFVMIFIIK